MFSYQTIDGQNLVVIRKETTPRVIEIEEEVETPEVVTLSPEPTKLERLEGKRSFEVERRQHADNQTEVYLEKIEGLKEHHKAEAQKANAEKAALDNIAQEIRLAIAAADESCKRAQYTKSSYEAMVTHSANSLAFLHGSNDGYADSLLEEFGC